MFELQTVLNGSDRDHHGPLQQNHLKTEQIGPDPGTKPYVEIGIFLYMVKYRVIKRIKFEIPLH
jgi:hypothetical protein